MEELTTSQRKMEASISGDGDDQSIESGMSGPKLQEEKVELAKQEGKQVWRLRLLVALVLVASAVAVIWSVYAVTTRNEKQNFESDFEDLGLKLVESFEDTVRQRLGIWESFGETFTGYVKNTPNVSWPLVALPDYEQRAKTIVDLTQIVNIAFIPLVELQDLQAWNEFSVAESGWREEGIAIQQGISPADVELSPFSSVVYNLIPSNESETGAVTAPETEGGPFFPFWQEAPATQVPAMNLNLFNVFLYSAETRALYNTEKPVFSRSEDFLDGEFIYGSAAEARFVESLAAYPETAIVYEKDPISYLNVPIFDDFPDDENRKLAGMFLISVYWKTFFTGILPSGANGIIVLLKNTCNQTYTYEINGLEARFVARGDQHDPKYDYLKAEAQINDIFEDNTDTSGSTSCRYSIEVYPSETFENDQTTSNPLNFALALGAVFAFTSLVFILYDCSVERRQKVVMKSATQSGAIVSSLFPADVRDRLYKEREAEQAKLEAGKSSGDNWKVIPGPHLRPSSRESEISVEGDNTAIANLYEDCTILFADIAGFTKWSSTRQPSEVFQLLETIYGAFDGIALRRGVFKVETIGDCYVAATGLPKPREDHAVVMVRFAADCSRRLNLLLHGKLVDALGEGTQELAMRFGINSGPVTAGVLRGQKSRFQIFGDTVNTAARIESTGVKNRIHVSESTAHKIMEAGKESWLTPREESIEAKGKGVLQTYWANPAKSEMRSSNGNAAANVAHSNSEEESSEELKRPSDREHRRSSTDVTDTSSTSP